MVKRYTPNAGDIIWIDFDPQAGHEQAGHRPAVVLTDISFNVTGLLICCPGTSQIKDGPFEVPFYEGSTRYVALANHVCSLDWKARKATYKGAVSADELEDLRYLVSTLIKAQ